MNTYFHERSEVEALRLADEFDWWVSRGLNLEPSLADAAAELRRLYDENLRLRGIVPEALEKLNDELCDENDRLHALNAQLTQVSEELLDALKKAQETVRFGQNLEKLDVLLKTAISHAESTLKTE